MTEIPEHLLKRSKERRSALGLPGGEGEGEAAAAPSTTPAVPAASAPAPAAASPAPRPATPAPAPAAPPPKPLPDYVIAAKQRRKIPFWVMPILGLLPVWGFLYYEAMAPREVSLAGPLAAGAEVYAANCSACHGADGAGGVGLQLNGGEVLKTFPKFDDQKSFIETGSQPYIGKPYGNPDRPGGQRIGKAGMPAWKGQLTDEQIIEVVCHERFTMQNLPAEGEEYTKWCSPEAAAARG